MSKRLRIQTDMAFDNIQSTIPLQLTQAQETLLGSLSLELSDRLDNTLVEGVLSINLNGVTLAALADVTATINVYRNSSLTNLAYAFNETLAAGVVLLSTQSINHQIPIQFTEAPVLKSTEDTVEYYVTITVNATGVVLLPANIVLTNYSIVAEEIAQ